MKLLGHIVEATGLKIEYDNIKAITEFPEPKNITDVRRFLGMINHLTKFVDNVAEEKLVHRYILQALPIFMAEERLVDVGAEPVAGPSLGKEEDKMYQVDNIVENMVEEFIITVNTGSSSELSSDLDE
ncbi:hypothetical protein QE152_g4431 [Popillia japonica]|uniref:Uncharacterized protein n=1 Tax=Popillia japonica TaxID=7064 RepID=A0AAW1N132_POPJA